MQDQVTSSQRIGLVLLNMGGPEDLDSIKPFLYNLFADPELIQLPFLLKPFQKLFAKIIAKFRTPGTKEMYEQIGGGSPILEITENLGDKLQNQLAKKDIESIPTVAMRYTYPRAIDAVSELSDQNIDKIILFSQYPHYADSTTGSSLNDFYDALENSSVEEIEVFEIKNWGTEPEYINWWVDGITSVLDQIQGPIDKNTTHIIFSAHGLPMKYIKAGEKYPQRLEEAVELIMAQLDEFQGCYHLAYQSRAGPFEWTQPYTDDLLEELADQSAETVIMVPLGFVTNHVETLYEIDILYRDLAKEVGIENYYRVEVPDADDNYARSITNMLIRRIKEEDTI